MSKRYYKDPTADNALRNVVRKEADRQREEVEIRHLIQNLFWRMANIGISRIKMVELVRSEYRNFLKDKDS